MVSKCAFLVTAVGTVINSNCHEKAVVSELAFLLTANDTKNGVFGVGIVINSK